MHDQVVSLPAWLMPVITLQRAHLFAVGQYPHGTTRNPVTGTLSVSAQQTRQLTLNEVMGMPVTAAAPVTGVVTAYPGGPLEILLNNTKWS